MPKPIVFELQTVEQTDTPLLARVKHGGSLITQAAISAISYLVKNKSGTQTATGGLTVASVVFDALQADERWSLDAAGYNFRATIPAAAFPSPNHYLVEIKFTPVSGSPFYLRARVYADNLITV